MSRTYFSNILRQGVILLKVITLQAVFSTALDSVPLQFGCKRSLFKIKIWAINKRTPGSAVNSSQVTWWGVLPVRGYLLTSVPFWSSLLTSAVTHGYFWKCHAPLTRRLSSRQRQPCPAPGRHSQGAGMALAQRWAEWDLPGLYGASSYGPTKRCAAQRRAVQRCAALQNSVNVAPLEQRGAGKSFFRDADYVGTILAIVISHRAAPKKCGAVKDKLFPAFISRHSLAVYSLCNDKQYSLAFLRRGAV